MTTTLYKNYNANVKEFLLYLKNDIKLKDIDIYSKDLINYHIETKSNNTFKNVARRLDELNVHHLNINVYQVDGKEYESKKRELNLIDKPHVLYSKYVKLILNIKGEIYYALVPRKHERDKRLTIYLDRYYLVTPKDQNKLSFTYTGRKLIEKYL